MDKVERGKATQLLGLLTVNTPLCMAGRQPIQGTSGYASRETIKKRKRSINK